MDLELARLYSTPGREVAEVEASTEFNKQAAMELFVKTATENGIDLSTLTNEQIGQLWEQAWGTKIAELPPQFAAHMAGKKGDKDGDEKGEKKDEKHEEKKDDKEKKAAAELSELQDERTKLAFADKMGRTMAHAFVNELEQIKVAQAKSGEKTAAAGTPAPAAPPATAPVAIKLAGALEQLAVDHAVKIATDAKLDPGEVSRKLAARAELGFAASTKLASAPQGNLPAAVEIRALEMLEQAGYPVTWS
jgi:hypothetical protein